MICDGGLVGTDRGGLDAAQILLCPDVQPFAHGHFVGGNVGASIQSSGGLLQLFGYLFLGFTGDAALDLLTGARVIACGISGFPPGVGLSVDCLCFLSYGAGTGCGFSGHN